MQCVEICLEPDGTFSLELGEKEETPEAQGEGKQVFKTVEEVLQAAGQLLQEGSMGAPPEVQAEEEMPQEQAPEQTPDPNAVNPEEEAAMNANFRQGVTGR